MIDIQLETKIRADEKTVLDAPKITLLQYVVRPGEKTIMASLLFEGKGFSVSRDIDILKYDTEWTMNELETHILAWVSKQEVKEIKQ